jgi:hypothetical protein
MGFSYDEFQKAAKEKLNEWYGSSPKEVLHVWWNSGDTMYAIVHVKKKHIAYNEFIRIFSVGNEIMLSLDKVVEL